MRITRLTLENFRVFPHVDLELPPGVVGIYGPNGSGKSTLVEAVLWALFGVARTGKEGVRRDGADGECRVRGGLRARRARLRDRPVGLGCQPHRQGRGVLRRNPPGHGGHRRPPVRASRPGHERRRLPGLGLLRAEATRRLLLAPARGAQAARPRSARHHTDRPRPRHGPLDGPHDARTGRHGPARARRSRRPRPRDGRPRAPGGRGRRGPGRRRRCPGPGRGGARRGRDRRGRSRTAQGRTRPAGRRLQRGQATGPGDRRSARHPGGGGHRSRPSRSTSCSTRTCGGPPRGRPQSASPRWTTCTRPKRRWPAPPPNWPARPEGRCPTSLRSKPRRPRRSGRAVPPADGWPVSTWPWPPPASAGTTPTPSGRRCAVSTVTRPARCAASPCPAAGAASTRCSPSGTAPLPWPKRRWPRSKPNGSKRSRL